NIPGTFGENVNIYDADFQHHFRAAERHDVVWGFGYRVNHDDVANSAVLAFLPAQITQQWFNGFVQDEIPFAGDRLRLTLGTKIEHNDYTGVEVEPGGRLGWTLSERQMLWGAVSRAVRTPSAIGLHGTATSHPSQPRQHGPDLRQLGIARSEASVVPASVPGSAGACGTRFRASLCESDREPVGSRLRRAGGAPRLAGDEDA